MELSWGVQNLWRVERLHEVELDATVQHSRPMACYAIFPSRIHPTQPNICWPGLLNPCDVIGLNPPLTTTQGSITIISLVSWSIMSEVHDDSNMCHKFCSLIELFEHQSQWGRRERWRKVNCNKHLSGTTQTMNMYKCFSSSNEKTHMTQMSFSWIIIIINTLI